MMPRKPSDSDEYEFVTSPTQEEQPQPPVIQIQSIAINEIPVSHTPPHAAQAQHAYLENQTPLMDHNVLIVEGPSDEAGTPSTALLCANAPQSSPREQDKKHDEPLPRYASPFSPDRPFESSELAAESSPPTQEEPRRRPAVASASAASSTLMNPVELMSIDPPAEKGKKFDPTPNSCTPVSECIPSCLNIKRQASLCGQAISTKIQNWLSCLKTQKHNEDLRIR